MAGRRIVVAVAALWMLATSLPARAQASSPARGRTQTTVGGSWTQWANCIFTALDPATGNFSCLGGSLWAGSWTGITHYQVTGNLDLVTGNAHGTLTETFIGTFLGDKSRGSLDFRERFTLDGATNALHIDVDIVHGSGDPTFGCSSGHVAFDGFDPLVTGLGGYRGTWVHRCH